MYHVTVCYTQIRNENWIKTKLYALEKLLFVPLLHRSTWLRKKKNCHCLYLIFFFLLQKIQLVTRKKSYILVQLISIIYIIVLSVLQCYTVQL